MDAALPILFLAGGEIFLALMAARVGVWVVRGLLEAWRAGRMPEPPGPDGPGGGLRVISGGARRARASGVPLGPARLRKAA